MGKTLYELSKIFVEHAWHVAKIIIVSNPGLMNHALATASSVITISLPINIKYYFIRGCWQSKKPV